MAAAKAAASRLAAKLPSQLAAAQPQGEPAKQQVLQDKKKLLWGSKKKEVRREGRSELGLCAAVGCID